MADRKDLQNWLKDALRSLGGEAQPLDVARWIWRQHQTALRASGDLFYTWQRDLYEAARVLRNRGEMERVRPPANRWVLTPAGRAARPPLRSTDREPASSERPPSI